jgi:hypothetical protein
VLIVASVAGAALSVSLLSDCPVPELVARLNVGAPEPLHDGAATAPAALPLGSGML